MFGSFGKTSGMWRFETLADFSRVVRWFSAQERKGRANQAMDRYMRHVTLLLRDGIDSYQQNVEELDRLCGGLLSHPQSSRRPGLGVPVDMSLLQNLQHHGGELRRYFENLLDLPESQFVPQWLRVIGSLREHLFLLKRLVGDFGNFEVLLPTLPGTGPVVTAPRLQRCIERMFHINMRNIRMLELARSFYKARRRGGEGKAGIFESNFDMSLAVTRMLTEYMVQADPVRIRTRLEVAERGGKTYRPYRFWRAAETFRLMADVTYIEQEGRKPVIRRRFVRVDLESVQPVCTDRDRMEWAMKEIFNNSLSASSRMSVGPYGRWNADPLERHAEADSSPAIRVTLRKVRKKGRWRRRKMLQLKMLDEGVGIRAEHLPYVTLWAYSPRREEFHAKARQAQLTSHQAHQEIQLGGKGIGLAYAAAIIREHGGEIQITSTPDKGTCVTVELPVPTPL